MAFLGLFGANGTPHPVALHLVEQAAAADLARAQRIARRWRIYHGEHPRPLRVRPGQPDDTVIVNYARVIVDKGVSFLFGQDVRFELEELRETEAEAWLRAVWRANRQATLLQQLALGGAVAGHAFLKIIPAQPYPRLVVLDPATVHVAWAPDDLATVVAYRIQYPAVDPRTGDPLVVRQLVVRDGAQWQLTDQQQRTGGTAWTTVAEATWPYPWPPIVDCQNLPCPHEYWGISDLEDDVLQLQAGLNFLLSNLLRIVRYHAHPKTWGRGFTASQLSLAVDETIVLPSPDAELRNLEMTSDLAASIQLVDRLREGLHELTRVPEVATGRLDRVGALSGVALQILYQPLLEKTATKRRTYGDLLIEVNRRLLALGGYGDDLWTTLHWPALLPSDPEAEAKTLLLWQQLGVSQDTLLQRLGLDPDLERAKQTAGSAQLGEQLLTALDQGR